MQGVVAVIKKGDDLATYDLSAICGLLLEETCCEGGHEWPGSVVSGGSPLEVMVHSSHMLEFYRRCSEHSMASHTTSRKSRAELENVH